VGIIGTLWDATVGLLTNPSSAGPRPLTADDLVPIVSGLKYESQVIDDVFGEADGLAAVEVVSATDAGAQIDNVAQHLHFITEHTYKTVLPHSMAWLRGNIVQRYVTPLQHRTTKLEGEVKALDKWETQIKQWRSKTVDPTLDDYRTFRKWFDKWPTDVLNNVHDWFQHQQSFSDFAVPIIARPFVNYLSADAHRQLLDDLTLIVLDASPDRYRHAVAAFEAMLDQDWP
jgi:hypothetical protein